MPSACLVLHRGIVEPRQVAAHRVEDRVEIELTGRDDVLRRLAAFGKVAEVDQRKLLQPLFECGAVASGAPFSRQRSKPLAVPNTRASGARRFRTPTIVRDRAARRTLLRRRCVASSTIFKHASRCGCMGHRLAPIKHRFDTDLTSAVAADWFRASPWRARRTGRWRPFDCLRGTRTRRSSRPCG